MNKPRLAFLDDHSTLLEGIKLISGKFNLFGDMDFFTSAPELLEYLKSNLPDLLVIDLSIGEIEGLVLIREIRASYPGIRIAIFTQHDSETKFKEAMGLGVQGYILKTEQAGFLPEIFMRILKGETYYSKELLNLENNKYAFHPLKEVEVQIIDLMKAGKSMKEIGIILNITPKVVEYRLKKVRKMYDAKNNPELIYKMNDN